MNKATTIIYLSGPDMIDNNYQQFELWYDYFTTKGYQVLSPHNTPPQKSWKDCMRFNIRMLTMCTHVCALFGWENNRGAFLEKHIAEQLGMPWCLVDRFGMSTPF